MNMCQYCGCGPLPPQAKRCPRCLEEFSNAAAAPAGNRPIRTTVSEQVIDTPDLPARPSPPPPPATPKSDPRPDGVLVYRPLSRPPMGLLCVLDDGRSEGEWFRLRGDTFTVGRTEGDLIIAHDEEISSKHLEVCRETVEGAHRWMLRDAGSTNGTFIAIRGVKLEHYREMLIGSQRYRFALPQAQPGGDGDETGTRAWSTVNPEELSKLFPSLTRLTRDGEAESYPLTDDEVWVGTDASCQVVLKDLMTDPKHCRLTKDASGQWKIEDHGTTNGTWLRLEKGKKLPLPSECQFQAGEQRFLFKLI